LLSRGNANADARFDVSDPIATLGFLFLGDPVELACEDAADADDDGALNLTDAVFALGHLFLGGPQPPPPFPGCGADPTADALRCASFAPCAQPPGLDVTPETGGVLQSDDGRLLIEVPPGAVSEPVTIRVRSLSREEVPDDLRGGDGPAGAARELTPDGLVFSRPLRITWRGSVAEIRQGRVGDDNVVPVPVFFVRSSHGTIEQAPRPRAEIDLDRGTVLATGELEHFTAVTVKNAPLSVDIAPDGTRHPVPSPIPDAALQFGLQAFWRPCDACGEIAVERFTFDDYDVASTDPSVLAVLRHSELAGMRMTRLEPTAVDFDLALACENEGSAQWGPVFSGTWEGPGGSFPDRGAVAAQVLVSLECVPPDLSAEKSADRAVATPGDVIVYTIRAGYESGPERLTGVTLDDVVPMGLEVLWTEPQAQRGAGNSLTWPAGSLGDIECGSSGEVVARYAVRVLDVFPPGETPVTNLAALDSDETNIIELEETVTVVVERQGALAIDRSSSAADGVVAPADALAIRIGVTNQSSEPRVDVSLFELRSFFFAELPVTSVSGGGEASPDGSITWNWPSVGAGERVEVRYVVEVPTDLRDLIELRSITLTSVAQVRSASGGSASAEESILADTDPARRFPLEVTKTDLTGGETAPGETVTYEVTLTNRGSEPLTDIFVIDDLFDPEYVTSVSGISDGGSFEPVARVIWRDLPDLGAGESKTLRYDVTLISDFPELPAFLFNRALADAAEKPSSSVATHVLAVRAPAPPTPTDGCRGITLPQGTFLGPFDIGRRVVTHVEFDFVEGGAIIRFVPIDDGNTVEIPAGGSSADARVAPDDAAAVINRFGEGLHFFELRALGLFGAPPGADGGDGGDGGGAGVDPQGVRVDVSSSGGPGDGFNFTSGLSAAPYRLVVDSTSTNLVDGDTNGATDVFVHDLSTGRTELVSVREDGGAVSEPILEAKLAADGRTVLFPTIEPLLSEDTNGTFDLYAIPNPLLR
jgi:uncharacterized repeat protein (TIGR01451 family)